MDIRYPSTSIGPANWNYELSLQSTWYCSYNPSSWKLWHLYALVVTGGNHERFRSTLSRGKGVATQSPRVGWNMVEPPMGHAVIGTPIWNPKINRSRTKPGFRLVAFCRGKSGEGIILLFRVKGHLVVGYCRYKQDKTIKLYPVGCTVCRATWSLAILRRCAFSVCIMLSAHQIGNTWKHPSKTEKYLTTI